MLALRNRSQLDPIVADELDHLLADLNLRLVAEHDDEGQHLPYTEYQPEWLAATAPPSLGNGSLKGRYARVGKTVHIRIEFVPGATTTFGSGDWTFTLPVKPRDLFNIFTVQMWDMSGAARYPGQADNRTGTSPADKSVTVMEAGGDVVDDVTPFTWADGDRLVIQGTYEGV